MIIRCASPDDTKRLLEIYAYYVTNTAISFEYDVPSEAEFCSRILNTLQKYPYLVLEEDGIIQGYAYSSHGRPIPGRVRCPSMWIMMRKDGVMEGSSMRRWRTA